jgi:putative membrane protein
MYIKKNYSVRELLIDTGKHFLWLIPYVLTIAILYQYTPLAEFHIPWLPLSIIGTAVAFYVGFKNNQAYDRLWEARMIWGGIVNSSRMWGSTIKAFVIDPGIGKNEKELLQIKKKMIYRQIAWLYKLRRQMLDPTAWEHLSLSGPYGRDAKVKMKNSGIGLYGEDITDKQIQKYLSDAEYKALASFKNAAAQMIDAQSQEQQLGEPNLPHRYSLLKMCCCSYLSNVVQQQTLPHSNDVYSNSGCMGLYGDLTNPTLSH